MRLIFLDVDGTYLAGDAVSPGAADAVRAARAAGHKVLLCTGRSTAQIYDDILEAGFDGLIAGGGAMVRVEDEVLVSHRFDRDLLLRAMDWLDERGIAYWLETDTDLIASPTAQAELATKPQQPYLRQGLSELDTRERDDVRKIVFLGSTVPLSQFEAAFSGELDVIGGTIPAMGENMGELALPGIHKATGIAAVVDHYGLTAADAIGFGDGMNDLEMLEFCGVGVVMGDARDEVKAVADLIVGSAAEGGVAQGFRELGLV